MPQPYHQVPESPNRSCAFHQTRPVGLLRTLKDRAVRLFGTSPRASANLGQLGEFEAGLHLSDLGYRILHRNWRAPSDRRMEIDLVCAEAGTLVFIEVKSLACDALQTGLSKLDRRKRAALRLATTTYLRPLKPKPANRVDLIEVYFRPDASVHELVHIQNVRL